MKPGLQVEGLKEFDGQIEGLTTVRDPNVMLQAGMDALQPVAERARGLARRRTGQLAGSITTGDQLSPAQAAMSPAPPGTVQVYVGPGPLPQAITEEFGTLDQEPHAFMRPAWDAEERNIIQRVAQALGQKLRR